jgi:hypothetical protein
MGPDAALQAIDEADRVDAETRDVMRGLHGWLSGGGFAPDWARHPKATRRFRKAYGPQRGMSPAVLGHASRLRGHATRRRGHATIAHGGNRYVVTDIQGPWIYTRRVSGSGGPGIVTFPSQLLLRKVG